MHRCMPHGDAMPPRLAALCALAGCVTSAPHPLPPPGATTPVDQLSALGLFDDVVHQVPRAGVVAYEVNAASYADGAVKRRFVVLPPGARIAPGADSWALPVGAYLVKTFGFARDVRDPAAGDQRIETRFLVRTEDGFVASTYVWDAAQRDATVSAGDLDVPVHWIDGAGVAHDQRYHVPGTAECAGCHAGRALGWTSRQLDHADQLAALAGMLDGAPPAHDVLVDPRGDAPLALRARSYLDANCGHCHRRGGSAEDTGLFWDFATTAVELPLCRPTPSVAGRDRVIVPGRPERSELLARMASTDADVRMPRGPTRIADRAGIALLTAWIAAMPAGACR